MNVVDLRTGGPYSPQDEQDACEHDEWDRILAEPPPPRTWRSIAVDWLLILLSVAPLVVLVFAALIGLL